MRKQFLFITCCIFFPYFLYAQIKVHSSGKYLVNTNNTPFFWFGDTAWELFHRLTREDIIHYLDTRQQQGFNVIQAVALAELNGLTQPNRYGDTPLLDLNPTKWDTTCGNDPQNPQAYDYWDHVDFAIQEAAKRDIYIALLPTWGDKVATDWGAGPQIFNKENAYLYGKKIAARYKNQWNVLWIIGGDRPGFYERNGKKYDDRAIWRAMAEGINEVYAGNTFMTYHPGGKFYGSSAYFHEDNWLDMNGIQSGHGDRRTPIWNFIEKDLSKQPSKPTMDLEPCYEDHGVNPWDDTWTKEGRGYFSAYDVRARMYRGVFAGGCGTTYGHVQVWQMADKALYDPVYICNEISGWKKALKADAAQQMHHLKDLMLSHKDFNRVEDSLLVVSNRGSDYRNLIVATKNQAATYALIYLPESNPITIDLNRLRKGNKKIAWFNPVTGKYTYMRKKYANGTMQFNPPVAVQKDWVLTIEVSN